MNIKTLMATVSLLTVLFFPIAKAQSNQSSIFPEKKPVVFPFFELSAYKPDAAFISANPNFLKDGSYELNASLLGIDPAIFNKYPDFLLVGSADQKHSGLSKKDLQKYSGVTWVLKNLFKQDDDPMGAYNSPLLSISSKEYPVAEIAPANTLGFLNNSVMLQAISSMDHSSMDVFALPKKNGQEPDVPKMLSAFGLNNYIFYNGFTTQKMKPYSKVDEVILKISYTRVIIFEGAIIGSSYPSLALFKLDVQDIAGKTLKTYKQGIFVYTDRIENYDQDYYARGFHPFTIARYVYPVILKNLLGQLSNDAAFLNEIKTHQQQMIEFGNQQPDFLNYTNAKLQLLDLQHRMEITLTYIKATNDELKKKGGPDLIDVGKIDVSAVTHANKDGATATTAINSIANSIYAGIDAIRIDKNNKEIESYVNGVRMLADRYTRLQASEDSLLKAQRPATLKLLAGDNMFQKDANLAAAFANIHDDLSQTAADASARAKNTEESFRKQLNDAFAKPETLAATAGNFPGTGGLSGTGGNPSLTACSKQTADDWEKNDPIYLSFMKTHSVSEGEYAKASLIDKTLQSCSSMMTPAQIDALKKASAECKATAYQMQHNGYSLGTNGFTKLGN